MCKSLFYNTKIPVRTALYSACFRIKYKLIVVEYILLTIVKKSNKLYRTTGLISFSIFTDTLFGIKIL